MKQWIEIWHTQKRMEGLLYENGATKKIVGHSKLKFWIFFWGHDEREWSIVRVWLLHINNFNYIKQF